MNSLTRIKEKILSLLLPKIKSSGYFAVRDIFKDLRILAGTDNPVIVDGGANLGETTKKFMENFKNPLIFCFEPNPRLTADLKKFFSGNNRIKIVAQALGSQNKEAKINISQNLASSSFLAQSEMLKKCHGDFIKTQEVVTVPMTTLDSFFTQNETIDILKLDLEGYELEALKGAEKTLRKTKIIMSEVWFSGGYEDAPHFSDLDLFLREHNFMLLNLYNPYTHKDMRLSTADAVFLNKEFFKNYQ